MAFIKSHSNYTLKKRHQDVSDGTIWERDITTIGGVNQFSPGQIPIYKSNNFIITVRNDGKISNQFNQTKWKENESGDTWTLETISGMTSEFEDQNDVKIVLKQDYYDFCDFAYYGSLSEMFRASITDILDRFPGELYCAESEKAYYTVTSARTDDGETIPEQITLGGENEYLVSNPFGINIHSIKKPTDGKVLKYFAEDGYKNYVIIENEEDSGTPVTKWDVTYYYFERDKKTNEFINYTVTPDSVTSATSETPYPCKGDVMAEITINEDTIKAYIGDDDEIAYLHSGLGGKHIRPSEEFIAIFYNECDNFENILLDRKTNYKSFFSVIQDNEKGYFRKMEEFVFPTSSGGYNVTATDGFANRLAKIGAYYDEYFTDNLWRSMTHEAIKNFDWTYTREYVNGAEEEYVHGGEKMQKALRVFAREFDEILSYINNIKNIGRVTYDERSNVPDYFLIDEVENKGWDVCLVYPYDLKELEVDEYGEYKRDESGNTIVINRYDEEEFQLSGDTNTKFIRQFSQNTKKEVKPYGNKLVNDYPNGYFITCCDGDAVCYYGDLYKYIDASGSGSTYYDTCESGTTRIKNRIKSYTSERSYSYLDANNEFMRRMAINAPYISRHKGTIEGIEMIMGMFGLKSKRWVESLYSGCTNSGVTYDYDIIEYSSFANRIEEKWDAIHQMYRYDWINSTKAIVYDYRSTSNYTKYGAQSNYLPYQGLPISFRDEYSAATEPYIKVSALVASAQQETTSEATEAFKVAETNELVFRRYLYPNFSKTEQLDGNPYFQMDGGWLSKTIENSGETRYNFQFDVDDNIAYTCYEESGRTEDDGSVIDNHPIYKETIRNIKRVDNIAELVSTPIDLLKEGTIYYVSNIEQGVALINDQVYPIKYEYNGDDKLSRYILFTKNNEYVKVGEDLFFTDMIYVYDKEGNSNPISLIDKPSGFEVKAYITNDDEFMCKGDESGYYTIDSFTILENALPSSGFTNYFIIDNPYYSNRIADVNTSGETYGWRGLKETDPEYVKINTITNYYEGNNPHNGNMNYDNGHEYFTYFKRLFKNPMDENLFDERCYENFFVDYDNEISIIGFSGLIDDNEAIKQYNPYLISSDSKLHYFGTYYEKDEDSSLSAATSAKTVSFYGESTDKISALTEMYHYTNPDITVENYILNDDEKMIGGSPYSGQSGTIDEITNQVINNKRLTIKFYLHDKWHSEQGQCELKYLDDIVMNYLTQMIPSTAIVDIQYIGKND